MHDLFLRVGGLRSPAAEHRSPPSDGASYFPPGLSLCATNSPRSSSSQNPPSRVFPYLIVLSSPFTRIRQPPPSARMDIFRLRRCGFFSPVQRHSGKPNSPQREIVRPFYETRRHEIRSVLFPPARRSFRSSSPPWQAASVPFERGRSRSLSFEPVFLIVRPATPNRRQTFLKEWRRNPPRAPLRAGLSPLLPCTTSHAKTPFLPKIATLKARQVTVFYTNRAFYLSKAQRALSRRLDPFIRRDFPSNGGYPSHPQLVGVRHEPSLLDTETFFPPDSRTFLLIRS